MPRGSGACGSDLICHQALCLCGHWLGDVDFDVVAEEPDAPGAPAAPAGPAGPAGPEGPGVDGTTTVVFLGAGVGAGVTTVVVEGGCWVHPAPAAIATSMTETATSGLAFLLAMV